MITYSTREKPEQPSKELECNYTYTKCYSFFPVEIWTPGRYCAKVSLDYVYNLYLKKDGRLLQVFKSIRDMNVWVSFKKLADDIRRDIPKPERYKNAKTNK